MSMGQPGTAVTTTDNGREVIDPASEAELARALGQLQSSGGLVVRLADLVGGAMGPDAADRDTVARDGAGSRGNGAARGGSGVEAGVRRGGVAAWARRADGPEPPACGAARIPCRAP